jgi:hypothetical protein
VNYFWFTEKHNMGEKPSKASSTSMLVNSIDTEKSVSENVQQMIKHSSRLSRNMMKYPYAVTELYLQRAAYAMEEGDAKAALADINLYLQANGHQTLRACCLRAECLDRVCDSIGAIAEWTRAYSFLAPRAPIAHLLEQTTFHTPAWCHVCQELLRGVKRQGLACLHCELTVHQQCAQKIELPPCALADKLAETEHNLLTVQNHFSITCEICESTSLGMNHTDICYCLKCEMKVHVACWKQQPESFVVPCRRKKPVPSYLWRILFGLALALFHNFEYEAAMGHFNQAIDEIYALLQDCQSPSNSSTFEPSKLLNSTRLSGLFQSIAEKSTNNPTNSSPTDASKPSPAMPSKDSPNAEYWISQLATVRAHRGVLHLALAQYPECIDDISFAIHHGVKTEVFFRSRGNAYFETGE